MAFCFCFWFGLNCGPFGLNYRNRAILGGRDIQPLLSDFLTPFPPSLMSLLTAFYCMTMGTERLKWTTPEASPLPDRCDMVAHCSKALTANTHRVMSQVCSSKLAPLSGVISLLMVLTTFVVFYRSMIYVLSLALGY